VSTNHLDPVASNIEVQRVGWARWRMRGVVAGSRVRQAARRVSGLKCAGWITWNVLTALSLLLCLATLALWVRSY
jgi:hypothetical protein